ncbi:MAG: DNA polymerase III subunit [Acidobacteriota bacterium]
MAFENIVGQGRVVDRLRTAIATDRLPSGMIFYGEDGVGKRTTALELARTLNCRTGANPCECESCVKVLRDSHPDVRFIQPDGQFIKVDQIEPLVAQSMLRPYEGDKRVYILDQAESIRDQTASRLLKTLEEPPLFTHFVLLTTNLPDVLPTIRSRCGLFYFRPLPAPEIVRALSEVFGLTPEDAERRGTIGQGSIGRALAMETAEMDRQQDLVAWLESALADGLRTPGELVSMLVKRESKTKIDIPDLRLKIERLTDIVRDAMVAKRPVRGLSTFQECYNVLVRLMQARALVEGNVNPEMTLEETLIGIHEGPLKRWTEKWIDTPSWV